MEEQLLSPRQVSKRLGLQVSTVYRWASIRRIPSVKVGAALRFRSVDLDQIIREGFRPALPEREVAR